MLMVENYAVREPRCYRLIARILAKMVSVDPAYVAMTEAEQAKVADAMKREAAPALARFVEGGEQLYPMCAHIATARKL